MDRSDHSSSSSSTPIKRSSTPKFSSSGTGTNENDQQMGMNLQNSKNPMAKHFMSPTISASSKAIAPRKKILSERNEISDMNIQKTSNFGNSEDFCSLNDKSSLEPHHTSQKNYPSPRPQFLRYKPNRRREIILQHENGVEERIKSSGSGNDTSLSSEKTSLSSEKKEKADLVCGSEEGEELDEGDQEVEEEEEEKEGFLRRVLKSMLVLFVLVWSTLYISSMNSNETSPSLQSVMSFKYGYFKIHDHIYGTMRRLQGPNFVNRIEFKEIVKMFVVGSYFSDGNMGLLKVNQTFIGECIEVQREMVEDICLVKVENVSDNLGVVELEVGDKEIEVEMKRENTQMVGFEAGENEEEARRGENFDQKVENSEFEKTESTDNIVPEVSDLGDEEDLEMVGSNEMIKIEYIADNEGEITSFEILNFEAESDFEVLFVVIGVAIVLTIVASLVVALHLKKKRDARKDSFPITNSSINQSSVAEKCNSELPNEREEQIKCVESACVESDERNQSRAPSIELLGEFSVIEISSSSFNGCGLRSSNIKEIEVNSISPSYEEDFTPQKKMINKEKVAAAMTPVRRSSRIRSRAVTSP